MTPSSQLKTTLRIFSILTKQETYETKTVLLATGKNRQNLAIPGYKKLYGKGISLCATCDGFFYRKKKIAIIGCGAYMRHELEYLSRMTDDITIFTHGNQIEDNYDYPVIHDKIISFGGDQKIEFIQTEKETYPMQGVFIALGAPSSIEFANQLGLIIEKGNLKVDAHYETNVPGVFAAGDIIGGKLQIAKAVNDGMEVADSIYSYIKRQTIKNGL